MSDSVLQIFVFQDGIYVGSELFTEPEVVVGSGDEADLHLSDASLGESHAVISREGDALSLFDFGHSAGTLVNGEPCQHRQVSPRDEIQIGRFKLKLKLTRPRRPGEALSLPPTEAPRPSAPPPGREAPPPASRPHREAPPPASRSHREAPSAADLHLPEDMPARPQQRSVPTDLIRERHPSEDLDVILAQELELSETEAGGPAAFGSLDDALASAFGPEAAREAPPAARDADLLAGLRGGILPSPTPEEPADELATVAVPLAEIENSPPRAPAAPPPPARPPVTPPAAARPPEGPPAPVPTAPLRSQPAPYDDLFDPALPLWEGEKTPAIPSGEHDIPEKYRTASRRPAARPVLTSPPPAEVPAPAPAEPPERVALGRVQGAPVAPPEDEVDEEELEAELRPGFSLLEEIVRAKPVGGRPTALEVLESRDGEIQRVRVLSGARSKLRLERDHPSGRAKLELAALLEPGRARIRVPSDAEGTMIERGQSTSLDRIKVPENAVSRQGDLYATELRADQSLTFRIGSSGFHLRFVPEPQLPVTPRPKAVARLRGPISRALGSSVLVHILVIVFGLGSSAMTYREAPREVWAQIEPEEPRPVEVPEPPPPPPEPEPEPEPVEAPPPPEPEPQPRAKPNRRKKPGRRSKAGGAPKTKPTSVGVLGGLAGMGKKAPGKASLLTAATNLDAVRVAGDYRTGGMISKAPSSEIRLAGGGGGEPLTRGSAELLRKGSGFAKLDRRGSGKVRGKVGRATARNIQAQGQLSRAEIQKVLNAHMNEISYCYERLLFKRASLQGKITVEWTIRRNGTVSGAKQKHSTVQSAELTSCLLKKMAKWRFPKPEGGVVIVSYPFNFQSQSY